MPAPPARWSPLACLRGDLTTQAVDAVVNAANESLRGGGGVDGALHRAAGPGLAEECVRRYPDGCPAGEARLTGGHGLAARYVIHAVGPVWRGGGAGEPELLRRCHLAALALAAEAGLASLAFPAISTGAFGYPVAEAARTSLAALAEGLARHPSIAEVRVVLFGEPTAGVYEGTLAELARGG